MDDLYEAGEALARAASELEQLVDAIVDRRADGEKYEDLAEDMFRAGAMVEDIQAEWNFIRNQIQDDEVTDAI